MKVTILGAGAYGLALAYRFNKNNNEVVVWSKVKSEIDELNKTKQNKNALGNFIMPNNINYTTNTKKAIEDSKLIVLAVATKYLKSVCEEIKPFIKGKHIMIASKGIDKDTYLFASNIVRNTLNTKKLCTLSGPSFAKDMIKEELIGLSLAATNKLTKKIVKEALENSLLKLRWTNDFIGVELCGTMKNVIAIAAGILEGLDVSESTKAMFLTESMNDAALLIKKLGGNEKTILSFAGFGDMLLSCTSTSSRNYSYGKLIGEETSKAKLEEYLNTTTVEGVYTLTSIYGLIKKKRVKIPFIDFIYDVVFDYRKPSSIIKFLKDKE